MKEDITKHVFRFGHPYNEGLLFRLASDAPTDQKELAQLGVAIVTLQKENNELGKEVQYLEEANEALHARLDEAERLQNVHSFQSAQEVTAPSLLAQHKASLMLRLMKSFNLIPSRQAADLTVVDCLDLIETLAPERVVILPLARKSAEEISAIFEPTMQLLSLLALLVTDYIEVRKATGDPYSVFTLGIQIIKSRPLQEFSCLTGLFQDPGGSISECLKCFGYLH